MRTSDLSAAPGFFARIRKSQLETAGLVLLLLYVVAGLIYSAVVPPVPRFTDEQEYLKLSYNLLHGPGFSLDGVHLTASRPPGYPVFLAAIRELGGGFFSFRAAQFLLQGATLLLLARLGADVKPAASLLIIVVLVICYPVLFYVGATLYPQIVSGFLFILSLTLLLRTPRGLMSNAVTGLVFAALILTVPTFLFTLFVVLGAAFVLRMIRWQDVCAVVLGAGLIMGAWTLRNALCFHRFVPIATNSGMNFLEGNNEHANAFEAASNLAMGPYYEHAGKLGLDEFQSDRYFRTAALAWIRNHPGQALLLYLEKVANFFGIVNVYSSQSQAETSPWKQIVLAAGYLLLLGLLTWRLASIRRFPLVPREKLFLLIYFLSAFTSAIFFTRIRHRLPYDYLIIAVIATHLGSRMEIWFRPDKRSELPSNDRQTREDAKESLPL